MFLRAAFSALIKLEKVVHVTLTIPPPPSYAGMTVKVNVRLTEPEASAPARLGGAVNSRSLRDS